IRKRPRVLTLLSLPEDVLFHVLKGLPAEDILSLRAVHSHLKYLVDNHASVWACASFQEVWPSPNNLKMFERAAERCNFEAAVKLGIAYLYNEGCKCRNTDDEKRKEALEMFEESSKQGCLNSSYLLWESNKRAAMSDPGRYLQSLRKLKDYAAKGCWEAQIALAKSCGNGNQLGLEAKASNEMVSQLFQASVPVGKQRIFAVQKGMNETMRYILIDWLVEVATMKDFSSLCLHMTVECVDRYLKLRPVSRARLQLLGIACMVICTRFISKEILTIREAVWLTDNTYKYEDLVRMMGEIISALEGKIRIPTIVDYKEVLLNIIPLARRTLHMYSFICELSLLNTGLCVYSPAHLSAAALLLTNILHKQARPWTSQLSECTGLSLEDLIPCVLSLHKKCFHDDVPKDYRHVSLTAVKQRFEDERYEEIGKEKVLEPAIFLCSLVTYKDFSFSHVEFVHDFLYSIQEDRGSFVTTPTAELSNQEESLLDNFLDWSLDSCSGYEGDQESEGEREGEVTAPSGVLDVTVVYMDPEQHCCQESSEEESLDESSRQDVPVRETDQPDSVNCWLVCVTPQEPPLEASSGYSSVSSASPTSSVDGSFGVPVKTTSTPSLCSAKNKGPYLPHYLKSCLHSVHTKPSEGKCDRRQVKRRNVAEHNEEERMNLGFLSL
uniref:Cyclin-F n=1 Tax=Sphenodon punctatus TaxID=8508 RepID=A0A8D0LB35_SPHPU